jgi:hypothetical protein
MSVDTGRRVYNTQLKTNKNTQRRLPPRISLSMESANIVVENAGATACGRTIAIRERPGRGKSGWISWMNTFSKGHEADR